jgi:excisionase family DNA binding protein
MKSTVTDMPNLAPPSNGPDEVAGLSTAGFATVEQAMQFLALSRSSVYALMDHGQIKSAKFGKARRLPWRALHDYAEKCLANAD